MKRQILYISIDGMTDPLGQSQVLPYLIGLARADYQITIISAEKAEKFIELKDTIERLVQQSTIQWIPVKYSSAIPIFSQVLNFLRLRNTCLKFASVHKISIVHCRSYLASIVGLEIKKRHNAKFIFDMRGFFADERIDGGIWDKKSLIKGRLYSYFKKKEIDFLNGSDYAISLTNAAKNKIQSWTTIRKNLPIKVIPCCVDLKHFSPDRIKENIKEAKRSELKLEENDFIISYLGSVGTWYLFDEMLDFFKEFLFFYASAKFLIITQDFKEDIFRRVEKRNIDIERIRVVSANRDEVPLLLSLSKLSIFFIKPAFSKIASSPTKMGEILSMGIPIITNKGIGDVDEIINQTKGGLLVDNFTIEAYKNTIEKIPTLLKNDSVFYSEIAKKNFSLEDGVQKYLEVYSAI